MNNAFCKSFCFGIFIVCLGSISSCSDNEGATYRKRSWKDTTHIQKEPKATHRPNFNIFIENSGSMDGYVSQETDFKNAVYGIVTDIKAKNIASKVNLFYVNDTICPFKPDALPGDIAYFIKNLNPSTLKLNGCSRGTSYLPDIIENVCSFRKGEVSILVSDCIFSTGNSSSTSYLVQQANSVELMLSTQLRARPFSTIILKLNSAFNGIYYIEAGGGNQVFNTAGKDLRRPYYVLIFGEHQSLEGFLEKMRFRDYQGFENSYYLMTPSGVKPDAKIIRSRKIGDFKIMQPATLLTINHAKAGNEGGQSLFQFSVAAKMDYLKMDETFISDTGNYELPSNYSLVSINRINNDDTNESLSGFTHVFTIKTSDLRLRQAVILKMRSRVPEWIDASSTIDDSEPSDIQQQKRTFGLKYLVKGMEEAYSNLFKDSSQFSIVIKVSKETYDVDESGGVFPWWIIVMLLMIAGLFIIVKRKNRI